jgi:hypothetical protein
MSWLERWHLPTPEGDGRKWFYHFPPGARPGKRSRLSSLSSLCSHISARGEIRAHGTTTLWPVIKADEHEENKKSVAEHEDPAQDR